ncbi:NADH dehydrogenase [ubiquinone] 1 alpha subcomplex subunit 9, mitochondrial-like isoform X2 [Rhodnius prolixus]|uniref:NADH dehydrogenase [ubiquinone] 1 alpha subcomplex subunit 9, mitochondrial n=1 Tax=Rhodnius prolixus TaxID=13249 RepID=T1HTQ7_RHOPR
MKPPQLLRSSQILLLQYSYRGCTSQFNPLRSVSPSDLKRGAGGRSSFSGIVCTLFGATGFLGRYVANKLGKIGTQLIIPYRGDSSEVLRLKLVGDLGQVLFQHYNLKDEDSIYKCVKYSNVVINLIGRDWETKNYKFQDVHVEGASRIARIAKKACVDTLIHVSSLNVDPFPIPYMMTGGSSWLISKYDGEAAVLEEFPDAIIFRPSDIYGQEDRFLRYYCSGWRHNHKWMPLYKSGTETEKQPVYVSDVAAGIVAACRDRKCRGKIFQAVGPRRYLLSELVDWFHRLILKADDWGFMRYDLRYDPLFKMRITLLPKLTTGAPLGNLHWERVEREAHSDKVDEKLGTLEDLGVQLTCMEDQVPWELSRTYKAYVYAERELMELIETPLPQTIPIKKKNEFHNLE